jgi:hypothetical protein
MIKKRIVGTAAGFTAIFVGCASAGPETETEANTSRAAPPPTVDTSHSIEPADADYCAPEAYSVCVEACNGHCEWCRYDGHGIFYDCGGPPHIPPPPVCNDGGEWCFLDSQCSSGECGWDFGCNCPGGS